MNSSLLACAGLWLLCRSNLRWMCLLTIVLSPMLPIVSAAASGAARFVVDCPAINSLTNFQGRLFFTCNHASTGNELWTSDGTLAGTRLFKDINPGPASSGAANLINVQGTLFFTAQDATNGYGIWKSDGTPDGTILVKAFPLGAGNLGPWRMTNLNGLLFFITDDGQHGRELWRSDGTSQGTSLVKDINPGGNSAFDTYKPYVGTYLSEIRAVNSRLFFSADDGMHGFELWASDGTTAGTTLISDLLPGMGGSVPFNLINVDTTLFLAIDGANGGLWKSDGTRAGTVRVKALDVVSNQGIPDLTNVVVNGRLFFGASDGVTGDELWISDGSPAGTTLVKDINPGEGFSDPLYLTPRGAEVFFAAHAEGAGTGWTLWKSDGTAAGTSQIKDILPSNLTNVYGKLLFAGGVDSIGSGNELWMSDGTTDGTSLLEDLTPGSSGSHPEQFAVAGGQVFFTTNQRERLWALPLTAIGIKSAFLPLATH